MARTISILKVSKGAQKGAKGTYMVTEVAYQGDDGKTKGMKIYPFGDQAEVAKAFDGAKEGDMYEVDFRKNDRDFWEFAPVPVKLSTEKAVPAKPATKQAWVPDEERQRMIVRQSSLSNAVALLTLQGDKKVTAEDVIKVAKVFEQFVMTKDVPTTGEIE